MARTVIEPVIEPRRIGEFLTTDENGYVQPDVAREKIPAHWRPAVDSIVQALLDTGRVESVYLRGSAPRGLVLDSLSDLDVVYLLKAGTVESGPVESGLDGTETSLADMVRRNFPFICGVEFLRLTKARLNRIAPPLSRPYFQMLLKTQSLFLGGSDVTRDIAPFRPDIEMVSHVFELLWDFRQIREYLTPDRTAREVREARQWFARRLVRSGLEVTMTRSGLFTRDLYLCYEQFAEFYPGSASRMYSVLVNSLNGHEDALACEDLVALLHSEGAALARQGNKIGCNIAADSVT